MSPRPTGGEAAAPIMECGVCWYAYEPDEGDSERGVAPGTPFAALPEDWCCPRCDAPRGKFLRNPDHG